MNMDAAKASATEEAHDALNAVLNALRLPPNAEGRRVFEKAWDGLEGAIQRHAEEMDAIRREVR